MVHDGKKRFSVCRGARTQGQEDTLSLKWMTHNMFSICMYYTHNASVGFEHSVCLGSLVTKSNPFLLLLVKSFKYDKWKPILNSENFIWLRLTSYGLNQELNWQHFMQYPDPQCSLYYFHSVYGLKIWRT